jgi:acetyl-CoA carboxylase carboxyl transferase subunit alpha
VIPEPPGGAHRDPDTAAEALGEALERALADLDAVPRAQLPSLRLAKYRRMGRYLENGAVRGLGDS